MQSLKVSNKICFFVCDIQEKFRPVMYSYDAVISTADKMVKAAAILGIPVIVTEQNPKGLGPTVPLPLAALPASLYTGAIPKTKFSMVIPEVEKSLKEWDTKSVVIFGIESCLDLIERGFQVHVLYDGVSSCNPGEIPVAIARMSAAGAHITTSESILFQILGDSTHPSFKQISGLVKATKDTTQESLARLVQGKL